MTKRCVWNVVRNKPRKIRGAIESVWEDPLCMAGALVRCVWTTPAIVWKSILRTRLSRHISIVLETADSPNFGIASLRSFQNSHKLIRLLVCVNLDNYIYPQSRMCAPNYWCAVGHHKIVGILLPINRVQRSMRSLEMLSHFLRLTRCGRCSNSPQSSGAFRSQYPLERNHHVGFLRNLVQAKPRSICSLQSVWRDGLKL